MVSVFLVLSAFMAWRLASVEPKEWHVVAPMAWALFLAHVCNAVLGWIFFFPGSGGLATVIAILLGVGAWRNRAMAA